LAAGIRDVLCVVVEPLAVLVLGAGLVVGKHASAVFHRENFIVDASVVAVLVPQIVEALSQLCDELVFLRGADFDAGSLVYKEKKLDTADRPRSRASGSDHTARLGMLRSKMERAFTYSVRHWCTLENKI
jgi:hypothetical protein